MRLYEIADSFRALFEEIEALDGEVTDLHAQELLALDGDLEAKLDACGRFVASLDAEAAAYAEEAKRLQARKRTAELTAARVRDLVVQAMTACQKPKVKTPLFAFSLRDSAGEVVVDEAVLADKWYRIKREVARSDIREALLRGETVDGASLRAGKTLVIR